MTAETAGADHSVLQRFAELYPHEVAAILEELPEPDAARILEALASGQAQAVFQHLNPESAAAVLAELSPEAAGGALASLDPARGAALLARLPDEKREPPLQRMSAARARDLRGLMAYRPGTAGQLMEANVMTVRPQTSVEETLRRLRLRGVRIFNVFLVDEEGRLTGVVELQTLALAKPEAAVSGLASPPPAKVLDTASREEVVEILDRYKLASIPVVDIEDRVVGVIRYASLIQAVEQEAAADLQSMVGAGREERALSRVSFAVRKRLPWLQINLGTAFLAAAVVGLFEDTIARFTALAVLLPVVAGQSGNTGAQALAVAMRGLALREITSRHSLRLVIKELLVGAFNGLAVAAVTCAGVYIWSGSAGLTLVIGLAMILSMAIAGVAGAAVPVVLNALGQDPAQSSSIILTTVTDVFGFFSFLGLATVFAKLL